jgi:3-hydroxyacyl-[acyl-carrier-protein] dehydratase
MRWHLLDAITEIVPGKSAAGFSTTSLPDALFDDHFPTFRITPGVLLVEMWAQLAGKLLQATIWEHRGFWAFPVLTMIYEVKFRDFVQPNERLRVEVEIVEMRPESAMFKTRLVHGGIGDKPGKRYATGRIVLAFDPTGRPYHGDRDRLESHGRSEFERLGSPWIPPACHSTGK